MATHKLISFAGLLRDWCRLNARLYAAPWRTRQRCSGATPSWG